MLLAWAKFVNQADPDVIIGYNISNFDFPYLLDRATALKAKNFPYLGRMSGAYLTIVARLLQFIGEFQVLRR